VAVLGLRGVPATWGGVERQCEELYSRLAAAGFPITVYCRTSYVRENLRHYRGLRLVRLPTLPGKHLEAFVHTFLACLHLALHPQDIAHIYSQGPALFAPLIRVLCPWCRVFFTCGGLDWQRGKWSSAASLVLRLGQWCSARFTDVRIMVSQTLVRYYHDAYGVDSLYIPNGVAAMEARPLGDLAGALGIAPRGYALFVGRLVPEKRVQDLIAAVVAHRPGLTLVIAGGTAASEAHVAGLQAATAGSPAVVFAGYRFGEELAALFSNARVYVTASELEGLPLSLLEAMAYGLPCLASDIPPHREALGDTGAYVPVGDVAGIARELAAAAQAPLSELAARGEACRERATRVFSWDRAAERLGRAYGVAMSPVHDVGPDIA
jgi:glycosyltransferase involved in cell wall biosynthesis